ncbi:MAG: lipoprotein insertase outer membrane protein LolB [Pseudomonadales bacterium]
MNLLLSIRNYLVFNALLAIGVAGCAALPAPGPAEGGFNLRGKIGVVQGSESFSARLLWQQRGDAFDIDLWGPLGQGRVRLSGAGNYLELTDADGSVLDRGPADAVMTRNLGWSLPLTVLPYWVRGRPAPRLAVADEIRDEADRLAGFAQLDWRVELDRYAAVADGASEQYLPNRITARRGDARVRLAVSRWQF